MGKAAVFIIGVYALILILATIYAIASHWLSPWAVLLAILLSSIPLRHV